MVRRSDGPHGGWRYRMRRFALAGSVLLACLAAARRGLPPGACSTWVSCGVIHVDTLAWMAAAGGNVIMDPSRWEYRLYVASEGSRSEGWYGELVHAANVAGPSVDWRRRWERSCGLPTRSSGMARLVSQCMAARRVIVAEVTGNGRARRVQAAMRSTALASQRRRKRKTGQRRCRFGGSQRPLRIMGP